MGGISAYSEKKIKIALAHPAASNGVCPRQRCRLLLLIKVNYSIWALR